MKIKSEKITIKNSKIFGKLIDSCMFETAYKGEDFSFFKNMETVKFPNSTGISMVEAYSSSHNTTSILEIHKEAREIIIPTESSVFLVLATGNNKPDRTSIKALELEPGTLFIIDPNIWHYAPITSVECSKVFIMLDSTTPDKDLFQVNLEEEWGEVIKILIDKQR